MTKTKVVYLEKGAIQVTYEFTNEEWFTILKAIGKYAETLTDSKEYEAVTKIFISF